MDSLYGLNECPICLEDMDQVDNATDSKPSGSWFQHKTVQASVVPTLLLKPCNHEFHSHCITPHLLQGTDCPFCRRQVKCTAQKIPKLTLARQPLLNAIVQSDTSTVERILATGVPPESATYEGHSPLAIAFEDEQWNIIAALVRYGATTKDKDQQYQIGSMYLTGEHLERNRHEAARWLRLAALQNHPAAQNIIGDMHLIGKAARQSDTEAFAWYLRAAKQGHTSAQNSVGDMYFYGRGTGQSDTLAVQWYQQAADQGHADAQNSLGDMYLSGRGVTTDELQAIIWYQRSADQGNLPARRKLDLTP